MATITKTITFSASDFVHSRPNFSQNAPIKGLKYAWSGVTIGSYGFDYGYISGLTITYNGTAKYAGVSFQSPSRGKSPFSVGMNTIDGFFYPFEYGIPLEGFDVKLTNGVPVSPIIIVNGNLNNVHDHLEILLSVGAKHNTNPGNSNSITVSFDCTTVPLYQYPMGLHVYSPYDSINTPKLTTNLYSKRPIGSWTASWITGTVVWSTPWFDKPALQYYYGHDATNKVYKVGGPIDRTYGVKFIFHTKMSLWRKWWRKKPKVKVEIEGPQSYYDVGNDTTDSCVQVSYTRASMVTEIINKVSIPQPTKYKYWMGYDATTKQLSNDNFFAKWLFNIEKFYPLTGFMHMQYRLAQGYVESTGWMLGADPNTVWEQALESQPGKWALLVSAGMPIAYSVLYTLTNTVMGLSYMPNLLIGLFDGWFYVGFSPATTLVPPLWIPALAILLALTLYSIFSQQKQTLREYCKTLLGEYTTTPYISGNTLSSISRLQNMSQKNLGYYCDGAYFYYQPTTSGVTVKELSSAHALVNEDPIQRQFLYSVACDDPTLVTLFYKLLFLPYTSGIPVEYGGTIYYSAAVVRVVPISDCAELLATPPSKTYTLPAGYCFSFISQVDADNKASVVADDVSSLVDGIYNYGVPLSDENLGVLDTYFTHEIRVETNPTTCTLFYNNTDQLGAVIGRKVYFDMEGRYPAMNGFYAIDGTGGNYRYFYKVENNLITNRYTMISSSSTTVQGTPGILSVMTNNLGFSSNWYIESDSALDITNKVNDILNDRCVDTNALIGYNYVVRGYYDSTNNMFYLYANNSNNYTISEAPADYYLPLIEFIEEEIFEYSPHLSIAINIEEICLPATAYQNALYGFYVIGSSGGNICPLYNEVNLTVRVYVALTLKHTYTVITNESGKTYVPYGPYVLYGEDVSSIVITSINGTNPIGNITYSIGTYTGCVNDDCPPTNPFASGLQACWNFEDAGLSILDSTGNNNLNAGFSLNFQQPGKVGTYSLGFPSSSSKAYISFPSSDTLALTTFSISAWVKCVGTTNYSRTIVSKLSKQGSYYAGGYALTINPTYGSVHLVTFDIYNSPMTGSFNTPPVNDGNWHHVVATYDNADPNRPVSLYFDGTLVGTELNSRPSGITYGSTYNPAIIGYMFNGVYHYPLSSGAATGSVDSIGIWSRVLTECDVSALYNNGNGLACT